MNNVSVTGTLWKDAEIKKVNDKTVVCLSLAEPYKEKGEYKTKWWTGTFWRLNEEDIQQARNYLKKGSKIVAYGSNMNSNDYTRDDGTTQTAYRMEGRYWQYNSFPAKRNSEENLETQKVSPEKQQVQTDWEF